jgi:ubiquinone/menaquinone biosynthesis C-methylase UbiE
MILSLMNRRNAKMNRFAIHQLSVTPSDRIIEIGFGGGMNLPNLIHHAVFVAGIDLSRDVVRRAEAKFSDAVVKGKASFHEGDGQALPFQCLPLKRQLPSIPSIFGGP